MIDYIYAIYQAGSDVEDNKHLSQLDYEEGCRYDAYFDTFKMLVVDYLEKICFKHNWEISIYNKSTYSFYYMLKSPDVEADPLLVRVSDHSIRRPGPDWTIETEDKPERLTLIFNEIDETLKKGGIQ